MVATSAKPIYVKQSISFRLDQLQGAKRVAIEEERHGNLSRYIQDLIDADLAERAKASQQEQVA